MIRKSVLKISDIVWIIMISSIGIFSPYVLKEGWQIAVQYTLMVMLLIASVYHARVSEQKSAKLINKFNMDAQAQNRMLHSQKVMLELSNMMIQVNGFNELMDIILRKAVEVIPEAAFGSVLVLNSAEKLEFKATYGFKNELYNILLDPKESYQWRATNGNFVGPIIIEDLLAYSEDFMTADNYRTMKKMDALNLKSSLSAPILIDGRFFGSINLDSLENNVFGEEHKALMAYFANQATIAITNHQLYDKMLYLSKYDGLTGALNRRYFEEILENILLKCARDQEKVTIAISDLNYFKQVNDQYGHASGDQVLTFFAEQFSAQLRQSDLFARFGGDEFVAVFFDTKIEDAKSKLKEIHQMITQMPITLKATNDLIYCDFCYGAAEFPSEGESIKTLIHLADQRMYDEKKR